MLACWSDAEVVLDRIGIKSSTAIFFTNTLYVNHKFEPPPTCCLLGL